MTTVWLALRADVRRRWPALLSLALLLGLIGGVVLTAAAGARRTDTAYPRLLTWANATQTDIVPEGNGIPADYFAALARQPHIAAMTTAGIYGTVLSRGNQTNVTVMSSPDGAMGVTVDRVKILAGRLYDPKAPGQAMVDQQLASLEHLTPGGTLRLYGVPSAPSGAPEYNKAVTLTYRVTAIVAFDDEIVPTGTNTAGPTALVSWPFAAPPVAAGLADGYEAAVRLAPGASQAAFSSAAEKLAKRYPDTTGNIITINLSDQVNATERAIRPEAVALAVFAGLAGLIALAVIGQLLSRQLALDAAEFPILRALGVNRAALVTLSLARLGIVTVTGAIVAVAVAIAASPLMPIGPARLAEPHPGVEVNLAILGAGFAAIALLPLAVLTPPAWRAARQAQGPLGVAEPTVRQSRPSRLAAALTHAGSVTGGAGVAMAFEPGHGRTAVPVRSALAGSVIAVAALAAAAVFGASLVGLVSTPHDYGQNWVQEVDFNFGSATGAQAGQMAQAIPSISGYAGGDYGQLTIDGAIVPAIGLDQVRGSGYLTLLAGRAPAAPDEIALGEETLRAIGARLGQTVQVTVNQVSTGGPGITHSMRVVGVAVLPAFSRGSFSPTGLGTGAVVPQRRVVGDRAGDRLRGRRHLLQLLPAQVPAGRQSGRRGRQDHRGPPGQRLPGRLLHHRARRRPAARRHQELRQHQGHPARPRRGARGARRRYAGPRAAHRRAPPPPRPGAAEDPRLHQAAGARHGRLGGQRLRRRRAARRAAGRRHRRPLGLGRLRQRRRRLHSGHRAARHRAARHPRHPAGRQPHRRGPGWEAARLRPALVLRTE